MDWRIIGLRECAPDSEGRDGRINRMHQKVRFGYRLRRDAKVSPSGADDIRLVTGSLKKRDAVLNGEEFRGSNFASLHVFDVAADHLRGFPASRLHDGRKSNPLVECNI